MQSKKKEIIHKEQITKFLLLPIQIIGNDLKYSKDFEKDLIKQMKFQNSTDLNKYRACVDLLDDTEYALNSFFKYQLGDLKIKNNDFGELYLRLYGILNAVYLQMSGFETLARLLNHPKRDNISKEFEKLDIYKLRGIAGSHTVNYMYDKETRQQDNVKKNTSFRIIQMNLDKEGSKLTALDENNLIFDFNILDCLYEYENKATSLLFELIEHAFNKFVNKKDIKNEFLEKLNKLRPDLICYKNINENIKYKIKERKRFTRMIEKLKKEDDYN